MTAAPTFVALPVVALRHDTAESVVVTVEPGADERFHFAHGQHLTFRRDFEGVELRRSYSICSVAPDGALKVAIKLIDGGVFSGWANRELSVGDEIDVMTPTGGFTSALDPARSREYSLIAAGSGITPIASIAATVLAREPLASVTLLNINRTISSIMLLDEIEALRNRHLGRLQIWNILTREPTATPLLTGRPDRGRIDELLDAGILPSHPSDVFVCGPEELVGVVRAAYEARGIDGDNIHDELFTNAQMGRVTSAGPRRVDPEAEAVGSGTATLHGRQSSFRIYQDDTLLDAMQRARPDIPYSCKAGVCSTCRAFLSEGTVTMAVTQGLVPGERESGYVLTCQARPTSETVRIDFDH